MDKNYALLNVFHINKDSDKGIFLYRQLDRFYIEVSDAHRSFVIKEFRTRLAADDIYGNVIQNYIGRVGRCNKFSIIERLLIISDILLSSKSLIEEGLIRKEITEMERRNLFDDS